MFAGVNRILSTEEAAAFVFIGVVLRGNITSRWGPALHYMQSFLRVYTCNSMSVCQLISKNGGGLLSVHLFHVCNDVGLSLAESISRLIPNEFEETYLLVYSRQASQREVVEKAFQEVGGAEKVVLRTS